MSEPKVSVIIPVYNAEEKVARCARSLMGQTLEEMEFIFVNDASKDHSYEVLLELEKEDDRIAVINCDENSGAGGARNVGMQYARGEYIGFVDADDFVKNDMFFDLYQKAKSGDYDIVDSPLYSVTTDSILQPGIKDMFCDHELSVEEKELLILSDGYIVSKLFKASLLFENYIEFRPKVKVEDADFLLKAILHAKKFGNISDPKYIYDNTGGTATWSVRKADTKEYESILSLLEEYGKILSHDIEAKKCRTAIESAMLHFYHIGIECCISGEGDSISEVDLKNLQRLKKVKRKIIKDGYDNPYFKQVANDAIIEFMKWVDQLPD